MLNFSARAGSQYVLLRRLKEVRHVLRDANPDMVWAGASIPSSHAREAFAYLSTRRPPHTRADGRLSASKASVERTAAFSPSPTCRALPTFHPTGGISRPYGAVA